MQKKEKIRPSTKHTEYIKSSKHEPNIEMTTQKSDSEKLNLTDTTNTTGFNNTTADTYHDQVWKKKTDEKPHTGKCYVYWKDKSGVPRIVFGPHWPLTLVAVLMYCLFIIPFFYFFAPFMGYPLLTLSIL